MTVIMAKLKLLLNKIRWKVRDSPVAYVGIGRFLAALKSQSVIWNY